MLDGRTDGVPQYVPRSVGVCLGQRGRHRDCDRRALGPDWILWIEVHWRPRYVDDARSNVVDTDGDTRPKSWIAYESGLDAIRERVANLLQDGVRAVKLDAARRCALKYLLRPSAMALQNVGEDAVSLAKKGWKHAANVGENLMQVRRKHLHRVQLDAELRSEDGGDVPVDAL